MVVDQGSIAGLLPLCWADLTVLGSIVESVNESEVLVYVSSDIRVVDAQMLESLVGVNQEGSSESKTGVVQDSIILGDVASKIREKVDLKISSESSIPKELKVKLTRLGR